MALSLRNVLTAVLSLALSVCCRIIEGQEGVTLKLHGVTIPSDSLVDIDDILYTALRPLEVNVVPSNSRPDLHDGSLLCETDLVDCCAAPRSVHGDWYFPDGEKVLFNPGGSATFVANRGPNEVRDDRLFYGSVRLFRRYSRPPGRGRFSCELPNATYPNNTQVIYANIVNFGAAPNLDQVTISSSGQPTTAGKTYTLTCSATLRSDDSPLPASVTIKPTFVWSFGPNGNGSLPHGVTPSETVTSENITFNSTLEFPQLSQHLHTGMYTCRIGAGRLANSSIVNVTAPYIVVQVTPSGPTMLGQNGYSLTCGVSGVENLNPRSITYQWTKNNGTQTPIQVGSNPNFSFSPLRLSDAGEYTCQVTISSSYLSSDIAVSSLHDIRIQIPAPSSMRLSSNTSNPIPPFGSDVTLTCTVELASGPELDIPLNVNFELLRTDPPGMVLTATTQTVSGSTHTTEAVIRSFGRSDSGVYTCKANVSSTSRNGLIIDSSTESDSERITTGVYLTLQQRVYPNNSEVPITLIGSSDDNALKCTTDRVPCCDGSSTLMGKWLCPEGAEISNQCTDESCFIQRGTNDGIVYLNRLNSNVGESFGVFCCIIPDATGVNQTRCVNIVSARIGRIGNSITGRNYALTCSFTGSTSSTTSAVYQWSHNNGVDYIELQRGPRLNFTPLRLSDAGIYTCQISGVIDGITMNSITYSNARIIAISVPSPSSVTIKTEPQSEIQSIGSGITVICTVGLSPVIMESDLSLLRVDVHLYKDGAQLGEALTDASVDGTTFTYTNRLNSFRKSDSGNYACRATVEPNDPRLYLMGSEMRMSEDTVITTGVFLSLNENFVNNNSDILISSDSDLLLCITDAESCCSNDSQVTGNWFFPNGSLIGSPTTNSSVYIRRGLSVVGLYWNDSVIMTFPPGEYRCEIPDANGVLQIVLVKINLMSGSSQSDSAASVAGSVVGVLFALILMIAVSALVLFLGRERIKALKIVKLKFHRGIHRHQTELGPLESVDNNDYVTQNVAQPQSRKEGENVELRECDEPQTERDYYYMDTDAIAGERMKPIPVSEFSSHVERLHADRDKLFEMEYESVSKQPQSAHSVAEIPHNKLKNRFANIFPYDSTRVKLKEIPGVDGSDYINASHLDGYHKPKAYIGAQGPLPTTVTDFWRMIWEKKLPTVVMLTRIFEGKKKCEEYWPVNVGESVEPGHGLTIKLTSVLPFAEYSVRKMTVTCSTSPRSPPLKVTQFHFTGWPDHGVPQNGVTLINFIKRVRTVHPYSDSRPLLVHCSAGVGRTGAFIVLDSMLERMKVEENLNIYEFFKQLRAQRVLMVQTQVQYYFIHDALNELIFCGDTEITAPNLRIVISRLSKIKDGETGYCKQFNLITKMSPCNSEADYTQAKMECNVSKNRYPNILPNNHNRVFLRAATGSDYINASFIDGYRHRGAYIAAQAPMENTVNDFWKMIWDYQSRVIVMLCKMQEDGKEACHTFLPDHKGDSEVFGKMKVKLLSKETTTDYTIQQLEVSEDKPHPQGPASSPDKAVKVGVFHYLCWPEQDSPRGTSALLQLIEYINKTQMSSGNKPITVMCNDGVGRTGTFICIHAQLERLKTEGVVDFFQSIKSARIQRAGLVPELHQYIFCHNLVADYLDGFDTYANFKELV